MSARSILGYQLTLGHSFNLRYTISTNDTHLHRTNHLLLGKAYVNSTSIQVRDICGFSDTNTYRTLQAKRSRSGYYIYVSKRPGVNRIAARVA